MENDETLEQLLDVFTPEDRLTEGQQSLYNKHVIKLIFKLEAPYVAFNETMRIVAVSPSERRCKDMAIIRGYHAPLVVHFSCLKPIDQTI